MSGFVFCFLSAHTRGNRSFLIVFTRKQSLRSADLHTTIESRVAIWTAQHLPGTRVFLPGSIAMWAGNFAPIEQLSGGSWSMAYNLTQTAAAEEMRYGAGSAGDDARVSLDWLKAFGVGAVVVAGRKSPEYWKDFARPPRFEGILPLVWREDDTSIYRVPSPNPSLAHIVPESALVRSKPRNYLDVGEIEHFASALDTEPALSARFCRRGSGGKVSTVRPSMLPPRADARSAFRSTGMQGGRHG
jgi:hypothetical protein